MKPGFAAEHAEELASVTGDTTFPPGEVAMLLFQTILLQAAVDDDAAQAHKPQPATAKAGPRQGGLYAQLEEKP